MKTYPIPTRRDVLKTLLAGTAVVSAPHRLRAAQPDRLRLAYFGVGGRGRGNVMNFAAHEMVAFADVDDVRAAEIYKQFPSVPRYRDYRTLLDKHAGSIDGVVISTPDHLHCTMGLAAIAAGKHVYLEKPLAPTLVECETLRAAAAKSRVCTQLGVHGHSFEALRILREWIDAGAAGRVEEVVLWSDRLKPGSYIGATEPPAGMAVPNTLDWQLWLGPRLDRPFSDRYLPACWRNWWDFGGGALADIAVHMFDALKFALDFEYPELVTAEVSDRSRLTAPQWTRVNWAFPASRGRGPLNISWTGGWRDGALVKPGSVPRVPSDVVAKTDNGMAIVGREGTLFIPDMRASVRPRIYPLEREREFMAALPARTLPRPKGGHEQEWIDAILGNRPASATFDYGAALTEAVLLGTLAQRTGKPVRYDPRTRSFAGNDEAAALAAPANRPA